MYVCIADEEDDCDVEECGPLDEEGRMEKDGKGHTQLRSSFGG